MCGRFVVWATVKNHKPVKKTYIKTAETPLSNSSALSAWYVGERGFAVVLVTERGLDTGAADNWAGVRIMVSVLKGTCTAWKIQELELLSGVCVCVCVRVGEGV